MSQEDNIFDSLVNDDDITWQSTIFELVRTEQMDPWDVDVGSLSGKFLNFITEMKDLNMKVSGKMILAATILLRLKSGKFVDFDLVQLENLMNMDDYDDFEEFDEFGVPIKHDKANPDDFKIYPRTPQPRKRKVNIYDIVGALEKVIESNKKKLIKKQKSIAPEVKIREHVDINMVINDVEKRIYKHRDMTKRNQMKFSEILPSNKREDKINTFVPLLHLTNQRITDLEQEEHFCDFDIHIIKNA